MLNDKAKKIVRTELKKQFGTTNLGTIRKWLKSKASNQYDCFFHEVKLGNGVTIAYTSNPNHFASFYFKLQLVGMTDTLALTKNDITKAGHNRNCSNYFAL